MPSTGNPTGRKIRLDFLSFFIFLPFDADIKGGMINPTKRKIGNVKAGQSKRAEFPGRNASEWRKI